MACIRRGSAAATTITTIAALPDDLLVECLAPLTQEERFEHVALVSKRFRSACLAPQVLLSVAFIPGSAQCLLPRLRAFLSFLWEHARHVGTLHIDTAHNDFEGDASVEVAAGALVKGCLSACSAAACLTTLAVSPGTPLADTAWLPELTALTKLRLGRRDAPLHLPAGISLLCHLADAELAGAPIRLASGQLCSGLTCLCLRDGESEQLPHQVSQLSSLAFLELQPTVYEPDSYGHLYRLPALRRLSLTDAGDASLLLPASLSGITQLEHLEVALLHGTLEDQAVLQAVLPSLQRLTCLCLNFDVPMPHVIPLAITDLQRLQRLCIDVHEEAADEYENVSLPSGPWLQSLRWLGLPWQVLASESAVLRGAPRLEYLASLYPPDYGVTAADHSRWDAWWHFVATHPPLQCLCLEVEEDLPRRLFQAMCAMHHRRPSLHWRCVPFGAFVEEVKHLPGIPADPGTDSGTDSI